MLGAHLLASITITQAQSFACALQNNGNLVAVGTATSNNVNQFVVARYTSSGSLDSSFGAGGVTFTSIGNSSKATAMLIQPTDGNSVAAGVAIVNSAAQVAIVRYLASNGTLDPAFGSGGIVTTRVGDGASINDIAIDANSNLLVVGSSVQAGQSQILLMRYTPSGSADNTFNGNGIVLLSLGARSIGGSIAIQPSDGKIVLTGTFIDGMTGNSQSIIARYNTDGTPDTGFGTNGIANCGISINNVTIQANGNIVVCGASNGSLALARFTAAGVLDTSFGSGGIVTTPLGNQAEATDCVVDASNNIVVTGFSDSALVIARYTSTGAPDTSFNGTGNNLLLFEATNVGNSLAIQTADGKIIAVGYASDDFLIVRYATNGTTDPSWGSNGIVSQPSSSLVQLITRLWDQKTVGTNGGTFTAGAWQTRTLNQLVTSDSAVTLSANQFTLSPGNYSVLVNAPAYRVGNHQTRLQNITDNITAMWGTTAFSNASIGSMTSSNINGQLSVSKLTTFAVQHKCVSTENSDGFGIAAGFGAAEIYTSVTITPN